MCSVTKTYLYAANFGRFGDELTQGLGVESSERLILLSVKSLEPVARAVEVIAELVRVGH
jgi:hypothetical protein